MKKPIIAVDIDDVLTDSAAGILGHYNENYGTSLTKADYYSKDIKKLGVEDYDIAAERFKLYLESEVFKTAMPIDEAIEVISRLSQQYGLIGVTSRPEFLRAATDRWIKKYFGKKIIKTIYTSFIMGGSNHSGVTLSKAQVCAEIGAQYMVEDHLHHALPVASTGIQVFLIDQRWNQTDQLPDNVTRVSGWKEIETCLNE